MRQIFFVCAILFLTGCAYKTGVEISQESLESVKVSQSTREDVEQKLGYPMRKNEVSGREIWYYDFTKISANPFGGNVDETVVIEFDKRGRVVKKYKTQGSGNQNPLLR